MGELLKMGADPLAKDSDGKTAMDYAVLYEEYEISDILSEAAV